MADFHSAATAAAARLRGINERAIDDTERGVDNFSQLGDAETEVLQVLDQIDDHADAIAERVTSLRSMLAEQFRNLLGRVEQFERDCHDATQSFDDRVAEISGLIDACEQRVTTSEAHCQSLSDEMTSVVDSTETEIETAIQDVTAQLTTTVEEIREAVSSIEEKSNELSSKVESVTTAISGQITTELTDVHDEAISKLETMQQEFDEQTTELEKLLTDTASEQLDELEDGITENLERVEQAADRVATTFETIGEGAKTTCDGMETTKDVMNTATKSSTIGIEKAVSILNDVREILGRV